MRPNIIFNFSVGSEENGGWEGFSLGGVKYMSESMCEAVWAVFQEVPELDCLLWQDGENVVDGVEVPE